MKERFHFERWRKVMDKLEQMEIMSKRIIEKCNDYACRECPISDRHICYYDDNIIEDYKIIKENCKIMDIDISDLTDEPEQSVKSNSKPEGFTKDDIEPGYLLQLKGGQFVIAMGEKRNLLFYYFDVTKSQLNGYIFCLDDIKDDFTALCDIAIIAIYGHTFSKTLGLGDRLLLWERKGAECKIYNIETDGQPIKISPNANTYLTGDVDGDIFIENLSDADETMTIHRENLPGLIAALQEIQGLYEKCRGIK